MQKFKSVEGSNSKIVEAGGYLYTTWPHNNSWYVARKHLDAVSQTYSQQVFQTKEGWVPLENRDVTRMQTFDSIESLEKYMGILLA